MYLVDTPITYHCAMAGSLERNWYYPPPDGASQEEDPGAALGAESAVVTDRLAGDGVSPNGCLFTYQPGNSQRSGLVSVLLRLAANVGGTEERIELVHQIRVANAP